MADEFLLQRIGGYSLCGRTLGKGAFARVELGVHRLSNCQVALKIINLNNVNEAYVRKNILRESAILKNLRHDNIVRLYETLAYKNSYCFVMEYLEGGDLQSYIREQKQKKLTEKMGRKFFTQLMTAIQYLHCNGIIHRDLKLQNIMLTDNKSKVKLVDFGLSSFFDKDNLLKTQCGSAEYAAPELFDKGVQYGPSVELWSLGVVLFGMTTGRMPFEVAPTETKENLVVQIRRGLNISHETILKKLTASLKDLLIKILEPDRGKRITLHEMFSHPWVTEDGKKPVLKKPPEVLKREIRQKVIEKVAQLYSQPVGKVMQLIRVNNQHSMIATYKILMDHTVKTSGKQKTRSYSAPGRYFRNSNAKKYEVNQARPTSARPDRRSKSALENKKDIKFHTVTCAQREKYESITHTESGSDIQPISSCLKITKKIPMVPSKADSRPGSSRLSRSPSPASCSYYDSSDEELQQTPFRLSPEPRTTTRQQQHHSGAKATSTPARNYTMTTQETEEISPDDIDTSNLERDVDSVTTTTSHIEGEFELEANSSGDERTDHHRTTGVHVTDGKVCMSFNGAQLRKGSFKMSSAERRYEKNTKVRVHVPNKKTVEAKVKCRVTSSSPTPTPVVVSPKEARQMKHRNTFPVRKQSFNMNTSQTKKSSQKSLGKFRCSDTFSRSAPQKTTLQSDDEQLYEGTLQQQIVAAIAKSAGSSSSRSKSAGEVKVSKHRAGTASRRCTFEKANQILFREFQCNNSDETSALFHNDDIASEASSTSILKTSKSKGGLTSPKRRVSFRDEML